MPAISLAKFPIIIIYKKAKPHIISNRPLRAHLNRYPDRIPSKTPKTVADHFCRQLPRYLCCRNTNPHSAAGHGMIIIGEFITISIHITPYLSFVFRYFNQRHFLSDSIDRFLMGNGKIPLANYYSNRDFTEYIFCGLKSIFSAGKHCHRIRQTHTLGCDWLGNKLVSDNRLALSVALFACLLLFILFF